MRKVPLIPLLLASLLASARGRVSINANAPKQFRLSTTTSTPNAPSTMASEWGYVDCGLPTDAINLEYLQLSPDPPVPGVNLTITARGVANERIEEGAYAEVTVKLGLIKLLTKTFDLCEEARNANATIACPIEKGVYEITQVVFLPKEIPPAKFTVLVRGYTVTDEDMLCLDLSADFRLKI